MSMFDRNVKIQFNRMKYAPLVQKSKWFCDLYIKILIIKTYNNKNQT